MDQCRPENWTLADDGLLLLAMEDFSVSLSRQATSVTREIDSLSRGADSARISLQNVSNRLKLMSRERFVETQIGSVPPEASSARSAESPPSADSERGKIAEALRIGTDYLARAYNTVQVSDSESTSGEEENAGRAVVWDLEPRDVYIDRPLPFLIDSVEYEQDDLVGVGSTLHLADEPENDEVVEVGTTSEGFSTAPRAMQPGKTDSLHAGDHIKGHPSDLPPKKDSREIGLKEDTTLNEKYGASSSNVLHDSSSTHPTYKSQKPSIQDMFGDLDLPDCRRSSSHLQGAESFFSSHENDRGTFGKVEVGSKNASHPGTVSTACTDTTSVENTDQSNYNENETSRSTVGDTSRQSQSETVNSSQNTGPKARSTPSIFSSDSDDDLFSDKNSAKSAIASQNANKPLQYVIDSKTPTEVSRKSPRFPDPVSTITVSKSTYSELFDSDSSEDVFDVLAKTSSVNPAGGSTVSTQSKSSEYSCNIPVATSISGTVLSDPKSGSTAETSLKSSENYRTPSIVGERSNISSSANIDVPNVSGVSDDSSISRSDNRSLSKPHEVDEPSSPSIIRSTVESGCEPSSAPIKISNVLGDIHDAKNIGVKGSMIAELSSKLKVQSADDAKDIHSRQSEKAATEKVTTRPKSSNVSLLASTIQSQLFKAAPPNLSLGVSVIDGQAISGVKTQESEIDPTNSVDSISNETVKPPYNSAISSQEKSCRTPVSENVPGGELHSNDHNVSGDGDLTHLTKTRARAPNRRKPKRFSNSVDSLSSPSNVSASDATKCEGINPVGGLHSSSEHNRSPTAGHGTVTRLDDDPPNPSSNPNNSPISGHGTVTKHEERPLKRASEPNNLPTDYGAVVRHEDHHPNQSSEHSNVPISEHDAVDNNLSVVSSTLENDNSTVKFLEPPGLLRSSGNTPNKTTKSRVIDSIFDSDSEDDDLYNPSVAISKSTGNSLTNFRKQTGSSLEVDGASLVKSAIDSETSPSARESEDHVPSVAIAGHHPVTEQLDSSINQSRISSGLLDTEQSSSKTGAVSGISPITSTIVPAKKSDVVPVTSTVVPAEKSVAVSVTDTLVPAKKSDLDPLTSTVVPAKKSDVVSVTSTVVPAKKSDVVPVTSTVITAKKSNVVPVTRSDVTAKKSDLDPLTSIVVPAKKSYSDPVTSTVVPAKKSDMVPVTSTVVPAKKSDLDPLTSTVVPAKKSDVVPVTSTVVPAEKSDVVPVTSTVVPAKKSDLDPLTSTVVPAKKSDVVSVTSTVVPAKKSDVVSVTSTVVPAKKSDLVPVTSTVVPAKKSDLDPLTSTVVPAKKSDVVFVTSTDVTATKSDPIAGSVIDPIVIPSNNDTRSRVITNYDRIYSSDSDEDLFNPRSSSERSIEDSTAKSEINRTATVVIESQLSSLANEDMKLLDVLDDTLYLARESSQSSYRAAGAKHDLEVKYRPGAPMKQSPNVAENFPVDSNNPRHSDPLTGGVTPLITADIGTEDEERENSASFTNEKVDDYKRLDHKIIDEERESFSREIFSSANEEDVFQEHSQNDVITVSSMSISTDNANREEMEKEALSSVNSSLLESISNQSHQQKSIDVSSQCSDEVACKTDKIISQKEDNSSDGCGVFSKNNESAVHETSDHTVKSHQNFHTIPHTERANISYPHAGESHLPTKISSESIVKHQAESSNLFSDDDSDDLFQTKSMTNPNRSVSGDSILRESKKIIKPVSSSSKDNLFSDEDEELFSKKHDKSNVMKSDTVDSRSKLDGGNLTYDLPANTKDDALKRTFKTSAQSGKVGHGSDSQTKNSLLVDHKTSLAGNTNKSRLCKSVKLFAEVSDDDDEDIFSYTKAVKPSAHVAKSSAFSDQRRTLKSRVASGSTPMHSSDVINNPATSEISSSSRDRRKTSTSTTTTLSRCVVTDDPLSDLLGD